jgi:four helix bundle protein
MHSFEKLIVWQRADELAFEVYRVSKGFPDAEKYGLTAQLRRAALSVPTNISEATGRQMKGDTRRFIEIAMGSLAETGYLIHFSRHLGFINGIDHVTLDGLKGEVSALLWRFYRSF